MTGGRYGNDDAVPLLTYVMPLYPLMHEMACDLPQEEIQLLAIDFSTMLFEWNSHVPGYRDWYCANDQTPAYRYLRKLLQVLQWLWGGTRWVLKSPQHVEQLRPLLEVFPDAKIVQTHRDPVTVTASHTTSRTWALISVSDARLYASTRSASTFLTSEKVCLPSGR